VETAAAVASVEADITIVGIGGGSLPVRFGLLPYEASVTTPYWGSRSEFDEVLELARAGAISVHTETYSLDEAPEAYERPHNNQINGRAVRIRLPSLPVIRITVIFYDTHLGSINSNTVDLGTALL
jgi:alcohol dehydrogenase, propanol-preferring